MSPSLDVLPSKNVQFNIIWPPPHVKLPTPGLNVVELRDVNSLLKKYVTSLGSLRVVQSLSMFFFSVIYRWCRRGVLIQCLWGNSKLVLNNYDIASYNKHIWQFMYKQAMETVGKYRQVIKQMIPPKIRTIVSQQPVSTATYNYTHK